MKTGDKAEHLIMVQREGKGTHFEGYPDAASRDAAFAQAVTAVTTANGESAGVTCMKALDGNNIVKTWRAGDLVAS